jgi:hypothetical protein
MQLTIMNLLKQESYCVYDRIAKRKFRKNPKSLMNRIVIKTSQRNLRIFIVISGTNFIYKIVLSWSRSLTFIMNDI